MSGSDLTTISFHGATLIAVKGATPAETLVAMKPVAEGMGLDWKGQHAKIVGHPVLSKGMEEISIPSAGGPQAMTALPLSKLNFWLATIQPNKVPNLDTRANIIRYQEECADVLFAHFFSKAGGDAPPYIDARTLGGVVKGIVNKRIEPLEQTVADLRAEISALSKGVANLALSADGKVAALERISVRQLMDQAGALSKGRNSLNRRVRNALMKAAATGAVKGVTECPHTGVALFPIDFAREWMATTGNAWVAAHNASLAPQGDLFAGHPAKHKRLPNPANDRHPAAANANAKPGKGRGAA